MENLTTQINNLKKTYREIFLKAGEEIQNEIEKIKPADLCKNCQIPNCNSKLDIFERFPPNCFYKNWQHAALKYLNEDVSKKIYQKWIKILEYRKNFSCTGCATCCKLACSEFSYDELKQKAKEGDNFANQFISIFIPYKTKEEANKIYPEYFELLKEKLGKDEKVYFYFCPKLNKNNRCSDYQNRPQICRDFPDNPLSMLPKACGFSKWKDEIEPTALMLHSTLEIVDFYKNKIPML